MRTALLVCQFFFVSLMVSVQNGAYAAGLPRHGVLGAQLQMTDGMVSVKAVIPGSAAAKANLMPGDGIRSINRIPAAATADVISSIRRTPAGTTISMEILRNGTAQTINVTVGTPAAESDPAVQTLYESVTVNGSLRRTLVDIPKNAAGRRPAVLLIGGIGCFSVDVAANPEDGYLRITRDLARAGFVTMRLEKSGVGDSQGTPCHDVDFQDESGSYAVALTALRKHSHVDPAHVYLLGHSIGTLIAPRLALEQPVAGIVVSEAVGTNWFEYELANLRRQLEIGGDPPATVDDKLASKERCMHRLLIEKEPEPVIEQGEPACKLRNGIYPVVDKYIQQVASLNVIQPWTQLSVPVLAVYGTADFVVNPADHARIVAVVNSAHPGLASLSPVDAMDHNLQVAATPFEFYTNNEKGVATQYQTEFSTVLLKWFCSRERCVNDAAQ